MKEQIILMADIIDSRRSDQKTLMNDFKELVASTNLKYKKNILSPLTITLGDEFQGIVDHINDAVNIVLHLEESRITRNANFKLRYVIVEGLIETPINKTIAYGMMGDGLTRARKYLENIKKDETRFFIWLKDQTRKNALNNLFTVIQGVISDWNVERDHQLIDTFLKYRDYKKVAAELNKERSQMWKRAKSLKINSYFALKEIANYLTNV